MGKVPPAGTGGGAKLSMKRIQMGKKPQGKGKKK